MCVFIGAIAGAIVGAIVGLLWGYCGAIVETVAARGANVSAHLLNNVRALRAGLLTDTHALFAGVHGLLLSLAQPAVRKPTPHLPVDSCLMGVHDLIAL